MNRKHVVIVAGVFPPEPIVSANLLKELALKLSEKYDVTVLRTHPTRPLGFKMPAFDDSKWPFKVVMLDSYTCPESKILGRFKESWSMGKLAAAYIRQHHSEIDFIYNDSWHLFGINKVARMAVKYKISYITPVQDIYPESLISKLPDIALLKWMVKLFLMPIDRYNLIHAAKVHTISEKMVEQLSSSRRVPHDKFVVVRNWQDNASFDEYIEKRQGEQREKAPFTFMYMGNVGFLAGLETVIEAFKRNDFNNVRLVIAGSGPARSMLEKMAIATPEIEFWDVPGGMVPAIQAKADVMLLSVKRGFALSSIPSKLPAYWFSSKPILAGVDWESDTAACIRQSGGGWVIEPDSVGALAEKMVEAVRTDAAVLEKMGRKGREYALDSFSRERNINKLVDACKTVIETKK